MAKDLREALAAERHKDLLQSADRYRLAAAAAPPGALRRGLGRGLVSLGLRVAGRPVLFGLASEPLVRKEEG